MTLPPRKTSFPPLTPDTEPRLWVLCKQIALRLQELIDHFDACVAELNGNTSLHARDLGPFWQGVASGTRSRVGVPRRRKVGPVAAHGTAERALVVTAELGRIPKDKGDLPKCGDGVCLSGQFKKSVKIVDIVNSKYAHQKNAETQCILLWRKFTLA